ncbi:WRKY domain-containing protein [Heracleum sosnowskyi]|uniref:WRKY domain-containing protein n=1 Tax=Heracleum sosnowskyi TaxID=360622 RepID=A0AAD8JFV1_9APIA|nr:WRKY domain-containing protein [Heracleum sosnowskyi]
MDPINFGKAYNAIIDDISNPYLDILNFLELNEDGFREGSVPLPPVVVSPEKSEDVAKKNKKMKMEGRIVFVTKSEVEIMDDGFKWRKYGKKMVKNSPNPRNYYKCSSGGCGVKKRVERDNEDSRYVITTYDGVHNHESPFVPYYHHSDASTLQPSSSSTTT